MKNYYSIIAEVADSALERNMGSWVWSVQWLWHGAILRNILLSVTDWGTGSFLELDSWGVSTSGWGVRHGRPRVRKRPKWLLRGCRKLPAEELKRLRCNVDKRTTIHETVIDAENKNYALWHSTLYTVWSSPFVCSLIRWTVTSTVSTEQ